MQIKSAFLWLKFVVNSSQHFIVHSFWSRSFRRLDLGCILSVRITTQITFILGDWPRCFQCWAEKSYLFIRRLARSLETTDINSSIRHFVILAKSVAFQYLGSHCPLFFFSFGHATPVPELTLGQGLSLSQFFLLSPPLLISLDLRCWVRWSTRATLGCTGGLRVTVLITPVL